MSNPDAFTPSPIPPMSSTLSLTGKDLINIIAKHYGMAVLEGSPLTIGAVQVPTVANASLSRKPQDNTSPYQAITGGSEIVMKFTLILPADASSLT